ncbi:ABC transporter ATP-binding protein [Roseovarius aestuarii]|uniref:Glutathione import ATP-binding protein GsiA n=1 Tax=Roseovarius aestuarii TaxID=475083 RepID=A0A1X7BXX8_9RHOB|nr:ABC transporter ATP-binding protein [Roseovarius aestuarii]SMC14517.1 Glutathione import ATP-binding protein GsiA [Roseovarius aestuarii]
MARPIIDIRNLSVGFTGRAGRTLPVLRNVDLRVCRGESIGIVGESGSGKSTLALASMGFLKQGLRVIEGSVCFNGEDMFARKLNQLEAIRGGQLGLIPQNSGQSLTPTMRIGAQMAEALELHCTLEKDAYRDRTIKLLSQVRLPDPEAIITRFPHELSGGQQQRVAIAMALAGEPDALLLDEPTTGLDVTTQAHILELLQDLARDRNMAMIYVSHDLGVIARACERVMVMYAGEAVLQGPTAEVLKDPAHPYARALLASIPRLCDPHLPVALDGRPPPPGGSGPGCAFAPRCALADDQCRAARPELLDAGGGSQARCLRHAQSHELTAGGAGSDPLHHRPDGAPALVLDDLSISYAAPGLLDRLFGGGGMGVPTVDDITITIASGETLGLVGESGSGKSTILKAVAGLLPPSGGTIGVGDGNALPEMVEQRRPQQLRRIQMIFQNPDDSLNPRHTVAEILAQPLRLYDGLSGKALTDRSVEILETVRLGAHYMDRLPGQLSGGEKQRVAIARAFAAEPEIVLCDEITSALDVSVQAAMLELLNEFKKMKDTTYVFVSHDLAVVRALSDRVAVLYQGRLCEIGPTEKVYGQQSHPYTSVLLNAVLEPDPDAAPNLMAEDVVELSPPARGCPFQRRCTRKQGSICENETPPWRETGGGHAIRCHIPLEEL